MLKEGFKARRTKALLIFAVILIVSTGVVLATSWSQQGITGSTQGTIAKTWTNTSQNVQKLVAHARSWTFVNDVCKGNVRKIRWNTNNTGNVNAGSYGGSIVISKHEYLYYSPYSYSGTFYTHSDYPQAYGSSVYFNQGPGLSGSTSNYCSLVDQ